MTAGIVICAILLLAVAVYLVVAAQRSTEQKMDLYKREQDLKFREKKEMLKKNQSGSVGIVLLIVFAILGGITLLTSMRSVDTGRVGVVTSYGRVTGRELNEGLALVSPWGTNNVTEYDVKVQKEDFTAPAATKDLQDVNSTLSVSYQLKRGSVSFVHQEFGETYQSKILPQAVNETFKAVSAKYTASQLITERAKVKIDVQEGLQAAVKKLSKDTLDLVDVSITNFTFSEEFNNAIEATQVAQQNAIRARQELETTKVQAEKDITAAQGAAEAQRLQQRTLNKDLLRKMEIEVQQQELEVQRQAIKKWNGVLPTTNAGGAGTIFNIPVGR